MGLSRRLQGLCHENCSRFKWLLINSLCLTIGASVALDLAQPYIFCGRDILVMQVELQFLSVMDASMSQTYQAMADAAVRAAIRGAPYPIPPQQYENCRDMVLRFNPRDMYGG